MVPRFPSLDRMSVDLALGIPLRGSWNTIGAFPRNFGMPRPIQGGKRTTRAHLAKPQKGQIFTNTVYSLSDSRNLGMHQVSKRHCMGPIRTTRSGPNFQSN
jgi:hypothetical protein